MINTLEMADIMEGVHNCVVNCAGVKRGDNVLIVTDTLSEERIVQAVAAMSKAQGADVCTIVMKPRDWPMQEPPDMVAHAMRQADVIFTVVYYSISHTRASIMARLEYGARYINLPTLNMDSLKSEAARFPAPIIAKIFEKVHEIWGRAKTIHITAENGTDITGKIVSKFFVGGLPHFPMQEGEFLAFGGAMGIYGMWPGGEAGDANGVMYFDAAHMFVGQLEVPLKYVIKKGRVVEVDGGKEAEHFRHIIETIPNADHLAEWMIGLNPKARIILDEDVTHVEAHRHAGSLHTAIGNSKVLGGNVYANVHLDNFIIAPTMTFDGTVLVDKGHLLVLDDPEVQDMAKEYGVSW